MVEDQIFLEVFVRIEQRKFEVDLLAIHLSIEHPIFVRVLPPLLLEQRQSRCRIVRNRFYAGVSIFTLLIPRSCRQERHTKAEFLVHELAVHQVCQGGANRFGLEQRLVEIPGDETCRFGLLILHLKLFEFRFPDFSLRFFDKRLR